MKGKGIVAAAAALLGILLIAALGVLAGRGACNSYEKVETLAAAEEAAITARTDLLTAYNDYQWAIRGVMTQD